MKTLAYITFLGLAFLLASMPLYAQATDESLVLYLSFEQEPPEDLSVNEHDIELVGNPKSVDGKIGKALEFSGSNYVKVPINDILQVREQFSVVFWVKREDTQPATWNYMVAAGTLKWAVIYNSNGSVYVWSTAGGTWAQRLMTDQPLTTDWTHIGMTYDIDSGVELYFNGEELAGSGNKPPAVDEIDGSIMVGARHPGQEFFSGIIDEVAIYNRILTLDEIKRDMEAIGGAAVSPLDKLASTWGKIKNSHN